MKTYLIDTNIFIRQLREGFELQEYINFASCYVSYITVGELWQGVKNLNHKNQVQKMAQLFTIDYGAEHISKHALELLQQYSMSKGLTLTDAIIAATAISYEHTLITENKKHFTHIPNLHIHNLAEITTLGVK